MEFYLFRESSVKILNILLNYKFEIKDFRFVCFLIVLKDYLGELFFCFNFYFLWFWYK